MPKVQVPQNVFEALEFLQKTHDQEYILGRHVHKDWSNERLRCLNNISMVRLAEALLFGYEPELSPEQKIAAMLDEYAKKFPSDLPAYKKGLIDFADSHGFEYAWLTGKTKEAQ